MASWQNTKTGEQGFPIPSPLFFGFTEFLLPLPLGEVALQRNDGEG